MKLYIARIIFVILLFPVDGAWGLVGCAGLSPLKEVHPGTPMKEPRIWPEVTVIVEFVVDKYGVVTEPRVIDAFSPEPYADSFISLFSEEVTRTILKWKFEAPKESCMAKQKFVFKST